MEEDSVVLNRENQDRLWKISLDLCRDEKTFEIANNLLNHLDVTRE